MPVYTIRKIKGLRPDEDAWIADFSDEGLAEHVLALLNEWGILSPIEEYYEILQDDDS